MRLEIDTVNFQSRQSKAKEEEVSGPRETRDREAGLGRLGRFLLSWHGALKESGSTRDAARYGGSLMMFDRGLKRVDKFIF